MFGVADVRRLGDQLEIPDVGRLFDTALFYGRVHISMDMPLFRGLIHVLGSSNLRSILGHHAFTSSMTPEVQGVMPGKSIMAGYRPVAVVGSYTSDQNASWDTVELVKRSFEDKRYEKENVDEKDLDEIFKIVEITRFSKIIPNKEALDIWLSLALNVETIRNVIPFTASRKGLRLNIQALSNADFRMTPWDGGVCGWSSVPLNVIATGADENRLTWADIFADINEYQMDMVVSRKSMGDLILNENSSKFAASINDSALHRALVVAKNVSSFEENIIGDIGSIGEAFKDGHLSVSECLSIIDNASKFKHWIAGRPYDASVTSEYIKEISRQNFFEKWPGRELKFLGISAAGLATMALNPLVGAGVSLGLGAFDYYYLSELQKGWKPNIFISELKYKLRR